MQVVQLEADQLERAVQLELDAEQLERAVQLDAEQLERAVQLYTRAHCLVLCKSGAGSDRATQSIAELEGVHYLRHGDADSHMAS